MTQVIKIIKGKKYYYYQDSIKVESKNKTINTCIGRVDLDLNKLAKAQDNAFVKHLCTILETTSVLRSPLYHFELTSVAGLEDTMELLRLIYKQIIRNITPQDLEDFEKTLFVKYVHGTTAMEGNTLSEKQAYRLLSSGLTPENKTLNETLEVSNYTEVKNFLDTYNGDVTERLIRHIHRLLMNGIRDDNGKLINAGEYRTNQVILNKVDFRPPPAETIPNRVRYLIADYYNGVQQNIHPVELASKFHQKFEEIHPFQDGNGRTGRAILNYMLGRYDFPQIYLTRMHQSEYLTALQKGNEEIFDPLLHFIMARINGTMLYLYSKTNLYEFFTSKEYGNLYRDLGAKDVFDRWMATVKEHHENDEVP